MEKKAKVPVQVIALVEKEVTIYCCDNCGKELNPNDKWMFHILEDYKCSICHTGIFCFDCMRSYEYNISTKWVCPKCFEKRRLSFLKYTDVMNQILTLDEEREKMGKRLFE